MDIRFSVLAHFTPKQCEAERASETHRYTLFGGSRFPGKSYWLRWHLLRRLLEWGGRGFRGVRVMLGCEDFPTLYDRQIVKAQVEFPPWLGFYHIQAHEYRLRQTYGGGVLCFRNLDDPLKYQSSEYAAIGIDELTKQRQRMFDGLRGSLRWPGIEHTEFVAASNPNGPGATWVRELWVERRFPDYLTPLSDEFAFVPGLPTDNPYLTESYRQELDALPGGLRQAWRDGSWYASVEGLVYSEFGAENLVGGDGTQDGEPDPAQPLELAYDDGYIDPRAILFIQRTGTRILIADEIYHRQHLAEMCASEVVERCKERGWVRLDSDGKATELPNVEIAIGSPEAKEMQARLRMADIPVRSLPHEIVPGIGVVRRLIRDGRGYRALKINRRCTHLLEEITTLYQYAEGQHGDNEKPVDANNHAVDALRYWCYARARG
jgi:hypothetical protein